MRKDGSRSANSVSTGSSPSLILFFITFGELGEKYLANYPFNKQSTKELHEQVVRSLLMPKWADTGSDQY